MTHSSVLVPVGGHPGAPQAPGMGGAEREDRGGHQPPCNHYADRKQSPGQEATQNPENICARETIYYF